MNEEIETMRAEATEQSKSLELLLDDNIEKEKEIKGLILEVNIKKSQAESMMKGLQDATEDQDILQKKTQETNLKVTALTVEKSM